MDDKFVSTVDVGQRRAKGISLPRVRLSAASREALLYAGAAVSYISIGVFVTEFVLSWFVAFAWLLLWVWALPAVAGRLRQ